MDDTVEVGEIKVQYTAPGEASKKEIDEFRRELRAMVASLEGPNAMVEAYSFGEFDSRLSWLENGANEDQSDDE